MQVSIRATNFVRRLRGLSPGLKSVAFVLADHDNHKGGGAYPSMATVAEEAGYAFRQNASSAVQELADRKVIKGRQSGVEDRRPGISTMTWSGVVQILSWCR